MKKDILKFSGIWLVIWYVVDVSVMVVFSGGYKYLAILYQTFLIPIYWIVFLLLAAWYKFGQSKFILNFLTTCIWMLPWFFLIAYFGDPFKSGPERSFYSGFNATSFSFRKFFQSEVGELLKVSTIVLSFLITSALDTYTKKTSS